MFGEAQPEDLISASQRNAVKNITKATEAVKKPEIIEEDPAAEEGDEDVDTEGVEEKDIELVMQQVWRTFLRPVALSYVLCRVQGSYPDGRISLKLYRQVN